VFSLVISENNEKKKIRRNRLCSFKQKFNVPVCIYNSVVDNLDILPVHSIIIVDRHWFKVPGNSAEISTQNMRNTIPRTMSIRYTSGLQTVFHHAPLYQNTTDYDQAMICHSSHSWDDSV
jgi:hypothetical protein